MKARILLLSLCLVGCTKVVEVPMLYPVEVRDTLSEWQLLTMAIAYTESKFDETAVGKAQDSGLLQIRPIYCAEINRLYGTDYKIEDAFDIQTSLEMYELMQAAKNPNKDLDKAIRLHNRSEAYRREVLKNLDFIRRFEAVRAALNK